MVHPITLKLEIDYAAFDAAQAKAEKLIATLKEAEDRMERLKTLFIEMGELMAEVAAQEKPPEGGNPLIDEAERQLAQKFVQRMFKPESVIAYSL